MATHDLVRMTKHITLFFFAIQSKIGLAFQDTTCPPELPIGNKCPQGCYQTMNSLMIEDGVRFCEPVGAGFYSPPNDNNRYPCDLGTFSADSNAAACTSCPTGTHSSEVASAHCEVCPKGTYSNLLKSIFCSPCDPQNYDGDGANSITVWNGKLMCAQKQNPTTVSPTDAPYFEATTMPTKNESDSDVGNLTKIILSNTNENESDDSDCSSLDYEWHLTCSKCPSTLQSTLFPIFLAVFIVTVIGVLLLLNSESTTLVWTGIEYVQLVYFLGIVPIQAEQPHLHRVQGYVHRWILSVFTLDIDAGLSWQCLIGLRPEYNQVFVLVWPIMACCFLLLLSKAVPSLATAYCLTVIFYLGQFKFVLTSFEALRCGEQEWFCEKTNVATIAGLVGLLLYGLAIPSWLAWIRYSRAVVADGTNGHWCRVLAFDNCRWWPAVLMIRRNFLAAFPVLLPERPSWHLTAFLVTLMASELLQRFASPMNNSHLAQNRWLQAATVDTCLQASVISLTGLSFLSLAMPRETMRADGVVVAILFLMILILSVVYWVVAVVACHLSTRGKTDMQEVGSNESGGARSTTSASSNSSKHAKQQEQKSPFRGTRSIPPPLPPFLHDEADAPIRHSLSLIPTAGEGDDLDIETVAEISESRYPVCHHMAHIEDWNRADDLRLRSMLRSPSNSDGEELNSNYYRSAIPQDEFDDTSTLTDNNSYIPKKPHQVESRKNTKPSSSINSVMESSLVMESSEDGTPLIFADDDEEDRIQYHMPYSLHRRDARASDDDDDAEDDDDDVSEVWIDEESGLTVTDKESGEWADAETGRRVEARHSSTSSARYSGSETSKGSRSSRSSRIRC